ncbi:hypothetical protein ACJX0J_038867, partial [Zea mays]
SRARALCSTRSSRVPRQGGLVELHAALVSYSLVFLIYYFWITSNILISKLVMISIIYTDVIVVNENIMFVRVGEVYARPWQHPFVMLPDLNTRIEYRLLIILDEEDAVMDEAAIHLQIEEDEYMEDGKGSRRSGMPVRKERQALLEYNLNSSELGSSNQGILILDHDFLETDLGVN